MLSIAKTKHYGELLRFFLMRRFSGFSIPDEPYFDDEPTALFISLIRDCRFYLEYGSGGSTVTAARFKKPFISVDTDRFFLNAVRKKIGVLAPDQRLVHADIGLTGPWGIPLRTKHPTFRRLKKWKAYPEAPWHFIKNSHLPDLVLIDGRFRVATVLACCLHFQAFPDAKILVDDYIGRPHYHVVEQYATLAGIVGRMAIFQPSPQDGQKLSAAIEQYSTDWR